MDRHPDCIVKRDDDAVLWIEQQTALLRDRRFEELDITNLIEELDSMARAARRELRSRLKGIMLHLLTCEYQPARKSRSWLRSLSTQRQELESLFGESPSLRGLAADHAAQQYRHAVRDAALDTGLAQDTFPESCPYTLAQLLDLDFVS